MAQSVIGALRVNLGLDSAQFERGAKRAKNPMNDLRRQFRQLSIVAAAAGAALSLAIRSGLRDVDRLAKASRTIDGTVGALQALELAGSDAGVSQNEVTQATQRMTREISRAAREGGRGADALGRLGLEASALAAMDADERVATISDRIRELGLSSGQTMDLLRDLGVRSEEMANLLTQGGGAIRAARREVEELGLALDESGVRQVERANDAMARISLAFQAFRNRLAISVAPALERFAQAFTDAMREGGALRGVLDAIAVAARVLARVLDVVSANLEFIIDLFKILVAAQIVIWLGSVMTAFISLARAIRTTGIIMATFTALTRAKITAIALLGAVIAKVTGQYDNLTAFIRQTGEALLNALPEGLRDNVTDLGRRIAALGGDIDSTSELIGRNLTTATQGATAAMDSFGEATRRAGGSAQVASDGIDTMRDSLQETGQVMSRLRDGMANAFASIITGASSARDAIRQLLTQMASMLANRGFSMLFDAVFGAFGRGPSLGGGSWNIGGFNVPSLDFAPASAGPSMAAMPPSLPAPAMAPSGGGGGQSVVRVELSPDLEARILEQSAGQSVQIANNTVKQHERKALPKSMQRIQRNPRDIG